MLSGPAPEHPDDGTEERFRTSMSILFTLIGVVTAFESDFVAILGLAASVAGWISIRMELL